MTEPDFARIDALLASSQFHDAWSALRPLLSYDAKLVASAHGPRLLALFASVGRGLGVAPAQAALEAAAASPDSPQALYDAAYALYEERLFTAAAALLDRAVSIAPGVRGLVTELCSNLEALGLNDAAVFELERSGLHRADPWCRYLYAFNLVMSGRIADSESASASLDRDSRDENMLAAVTQLDAMHARARALGAVTRLDDRDLTGWHAVLNASVLLHESPDGYDEPMHGRYAWLSDSYALMREGIESLRALSTAMEWRLSRVISGPDRSSRILALAASQLLSLPLVPWSEGATSDGLVVIADLDAVGDVEVLRTLAQHRPGLRLWAHASNWVNPFPYAPDLTTMLVQSRVDPWSGGAMRVDPETQQVVVAEPDNEPDALHASRIVDASIERRSARSIDDVVAIVRAARSLPAPSSLGVFRDNGRRTIQRMGSAVKSNYFT
ncbi:MAG: hypothetical protein JNK05_19675 [Myxococcales bacterium]|nr:hypothetical protein [Myxococcales bacterium]